MNSTKSMIGNLLGAAGAVEAIATVKVIDYEALSRFSVFYKEIYVVLKVALGFPLRLYRQGGSIQIPILKTLTKALYVSASLNLINCSAAFSVLGSQHLKMKSTLRTKDNLIIENMFWFLLQQNAGTTITFTHTHTHIYSEVKKKKKA